MRKLSPESSKESPTAEIARLSTLSLSILRNEWSSVFRREPPVGLSRDMLTRMLVWQIQELEFGGHSREVLKLFGQLARNINAGPERRHLKPGTVLVREYRNKRHTVTIIDGGFQWEGARYTNLTAIARAITGTNWNGPRFFGLRDSKSTNEMSK